MTLKYAICPGYVTSKNDGNVHFINASQLMRRYQVRPEECVVVDIHNMKDPKLTLAEHQMVTLNLIRLAPQFDGNYTIPRSTT